MSDSESVDIEYSLKGVITAKLPFGIDKNDEKAVSVWAIRHLIAKMNTEEGFDEIIQNLFAVMDEWHDVDLNAVTAIEEDTSIASFNKPEHFYYRRKSYFEVEEYERLENQLTKAEYNMLQESVADLMGDDDGE